MTAHAHRMPDAISTRTGLMRGPAIAQPDPSAPDATHRDEPGCLSVLSKMGINKKLVAGV